MTIYQRLKLLATEKKISIAELERILGFANGSIRKWDKQPPGSPKLQKVADYFDVSTDYLLGRTDKRRYYDLTEKDEREITDELQNMIDDLAISFSKDDSEVDRETRELLIASLENSLRIAKIEAKKRFTPKKYRD